MKRLLITFFTAFLLLSFVPMASFAQISATGNDYYLRQATDAFENEKDPLKALELINKQLSSSPRNIGALILRSRILADMGNYGNALTDINKALKINQSANGGYSNPYLYWFKAVIYTEMDDNQKALANFRTAYTLAKKEKDENLHGISSAYADLLFSLDRQDEADDIYKAMLKRNDVDQVAIVGRARNMIVKGQSDEALRLLDKCLKLDSSYPEVYRFKTVAHDQLGQTVDAIKSAIRWLELDDTADTDFIIKVMSKRFSYAEANLKSCIKNNEKSLIFLSVLAGLYEDNHKYKEAVKSYDDLEWNVGYFDEICHFRARCYDNLGMYAKAVEDITKVLQNRPIWVYYCERGSYYWHAGDLDKALSDFTSAIYDAPEESFGYYMRGWIYDTLGDTEKAMADYDLGIELDNDYPYLHLMRGELLLSQGKREEAKKDFQAILLNEVDAIGIFTSLTGIRINTVFERVTDTIGIPYTVVQRSDDIQESSNRLGIGFG